MRSLALVLCLCTGCDLLFDIHHIGFAPDGQTGSDGGSGSDGGLGPGGCSPITMLADDFTTDDLTTMWPQSTTLGANVIDVSGGQALIENVTAGSYATLDPGRYYDLRDHYFSARITDNATVDANDYIALNIDSEIAGYGATFSRNATTMTFELAVPNAAPTIVAAFPYDPIEHAYLRVGVIGGALVFETSQNAITWTRHCVPSREVLQRLLLDAGVHLAELLGDLELLAVPRERDEAEGHLALQDLALVARRMCHAVP